MKLGVARGLLASLKRLRLRDQRLVLSPSETPLRSASSPSLVPRVEHGRPVPLGRSFAAAAPQLQRTSCLHTLQAALNGLKISLPKRITDVLTPAIRAPSPLASFSSRAYIPLGESKNAAIPSSSAALTPRYVHVGGLSLRSAAIMTATPPAGMQDRWQRGMASASKVKKIKMKSYSSFKGRFRVLSSGEIKRTRAGKQHNGKSKTPKQRRQLRRPGVVSHGLRYPMLKLGFFA
eukprot:jgi/Mesen1/2309/ME000155S01399